jgi:hypothetical protein
VEKCQPYFQDAYKVLREEFKLSDVTILFLALLIPTTAGMMCIFLADVWVVRSVRKTSAEARHRQALLAAQRWGLYKLTHR